MASPSAEVADARLNDTRGVVALLVWRCRCLGATPAWSAGAPDPNPGRITLTGGIDLRERLSCSAASRRTRAASSCGRTAIWVSRCFPATAAEERRRQRRHVEQPAHRVTAGRRQPSQRQTLVRVRLLRDVRARLRRRDERGRDLHGLYEPERAVRDGEGTGVQVRASTTAARSGGRRSSRTCCVARELERPGRRRDGRRHVSRARRIAPGFPASRVSGDRCR